jgi:hypothetical protein
MEEAAKSQNQEQSTKINNSDTKLAKTNSEIFD